MKNREDIRMIEPTLPHKHNTRQHWPEIYSLPGSSSIHDSDNVRGGSYESPGS